MQARSGDGVAVMTRCLIDGRGHDEMRQHVNTGEKLNKSGPQPLHTRWRSVAVNIMLVGPMSGASKGNGQGRSHMQLERQGEIEHSSMQLQHGTDERRDTRARDGSIARRILGLVAATGLLGLRPSRGL